MPSVQYFLPIKEIKEGVIILKDGTWRGILGASSINFGLMRPEEQDAIIYQYQSFLNSLDFHIQILVQSRKLNLEGYIKELKNLEEKQETELLRMQATNYREFIEGISQMINLMTKYFFIIVSFKPSLLKRSYSEEEFQRWKSQLQERMMYVANGLGRCGIKCKILEQEEVIEVLWSSFNLSEAEKGQFPILR